MQGTGIQWCDDTVNPTMGCDGCELWGAQRKSCYAGVLHERKGGKHPGFAPSFERVTRFAGRMAKAVLMIAAIRGDSVKFTGEIRARCR
ncbi:hypothetical protein [Sorangium sp. So ce204]|uniref:hypothetical protein n=1 Tax=Sorangium sp. So ce204 TaxID=3133288 RepID=UPI003F5D763F